VTSLPKHLDQQIQRNIPPLRAGDVELSEAAHTVTVAGHPTRLTPQEFRLLTLLLHNVDYVVPTQYLFDRLWGPDHIGDPSTLKVHVMRLRKKLDRKHPGTSAHIRTVRGFGYIFDSTPEPPDR
jgi:DNA-binding response OmpR family regulator